MKRAISIVVVLGLIGVAGAIAAGTMSDDAPSSKCPEGTTEWSSINELAGPAGPTREDAIRVELEQIGMDASDDAIAAGVVAAGLGGNKGHEEVDVRTEDGWVVTMTLTPLDPGWAVESSRWCAPGSD